MKKLYHLMMMYAMMGMSMPSHLVSTDSPMFRELTPEELAHLARIRAQKHAERLKNKGLKEFTIDGITVMALNKKNALRRISKIIELTKNQ